MPVNKARVLQAWPLAGKLIPRAELGNGLGRWLWDQGQTDSHLYDTAVVYSPYPF